MNRQMDDLIRRKDALEALLGAMCGTGYQTKAIDAIRTVPAIKSENLRVEMTYEDIISQLEIQKTIPDLESFPQKRTRIAEKKWNDWLPTSSMV